MKLWKKILIIVGSIIVYCMPIILIFALSSREINEYDIKININKEEKPYGDLIQPIRCTVDEYIVVDGKMISDNRVKQEISGVYSENIVVNVKSGQEVYYGQEIARHNGNIVYSSCNGIVEEINLSDTKPYIEILSFDNLLLEIKINAKDYNKLKDIMHDENGNEVTIVTRSNQVIDNKYVARLRINNPDFKYGMDVKGLRLFTGVKIENALVLEKTCIYEKNGKKGKYVRIFDEFGKYVEEKEINISYEIDEMVCITGVDENIYCDAGYSLAVSNIGKDNTDD